MVGKECVVVYVPELGQIKDGSIRVCNASPSVSPLKFENIQMKRTGVGEESSASIGTSLSLRAGQQTIGQQRISAEKDRKDDSRCNLYNEEDEEDESGMNRQGQGSRASRRSPMLRSAYEDSVREALGGANCRLPASGNLAAPLLSHSKSSNDGLGTKGTRNASKSPTRSSFSVLQTRRTEPPRSTLPNGLSQQQESAVGGDRNNSRGPLKFTEVGGGESAG